MVETKNNGNFCMQHHELTEDTVEHQPRKDFQMEIASVSGSTYKHQRIRNSMHTETPFCKKFFGIGEQSADMPTSALIYPLSTFTLMWTVFTAMMLLYTAVVVPPVMAFYWEAVACEAPPPTIYTDIFVDSFFIIDIMISFSTGFILHGKYVDRRSTVAKNYLANGFLFDFFTSVPVSYVQLYTYNMCLKRTEDTASDASQIKFMRILKPMRWFKIARLLKMSKLKDVTNLLVDRLGVPPRVIRMSAVVVGIFLGVHIFACLFWFVKIMSCSSEEIEEFLFSKGISSIDSTEGKIRSYVTAFYFIVTIWTTVGFGDISADNTGEQLFLIVTMFLGSIIFATLISEVQDMHQQSRRVDIAKGNRVQLAIDFLQENKVPEKLHHAIIDWTRFSFEQQQVTEDKRTIVNDLPPLLQCRLIEFLHSPAFCRVSIIGLCDSLDDSFMVEICKHIHYETIIKGSIVIPMYDACDRLVLIAQGLCSLEVEREDDAHHHKVPNEIQLNRGDFVGENSLLGENDWGASFLVASPGRHIQVRAVSYVVCTTLSVEDFNSVLTSLPTILRKQVRVYKKEQSRCFENLDFGPAAAQHDMNCVKWARLSRKCLRKKDARNDMQGLPQPASKSASPKLSTRITDRNQNDSDSLPIRSLIGTKPPRFKQIESPLGPPPRVGVACLLGGAVSEEVERRISDILVDVGAKVNVQIEKRAQQDKDWLKDQMSTIYQDGQDRMSHELHNVQTQVSNMQKNLDSMTRLLSEVNEKLGEPVARAKPEMPTPNIFPATASRKAQSDKGILSNVRAQLRVRSSIV